MITIGKSTYDMADLWVHDYNDTFGVHYGINTSNYINPITGQNYIDDHDTAKLTEKILNKLPNKDNINPYLYPYTGTINKGETFDEAKKRYYKSPFITQGGDGDHQHPIIAVFDGEDYIWPSRNTKDVEGNILYVFKDYASNTKQEIINNNSRTKNISKTGGSFMLYVDTYNTNKLYKCNYSFNVLSPFDKWIYVENGTPTKESQNIINNKDVTVINREYNANTGSVWWDYSINETNNTLIGVAMHEKNATEVDSTLNVIIKPNLSPFSRTATLMLYNQFDQYKGMYIGEINGNGSDVIVYTINQDADDINFDKIEFYTNDNTSAKVKTDCYGPMSSNGGDGWIYFKITGTSSQGAIRTFGEYPNQNIGKLRWSYYNSTGCTLYNPTFNPGTGIWTMKINFASNKPSSTIIYSGTITATVDKSIVSYNGKETAQITPSGITSSIDKETTAKNFKIKISQIEELNIEPIYNSNTSGETCYIQNVGRSIEIKQPTYGYELVDKTIKWAKVSQSGLVSFEQNNTLNKRIVEIKVFCNENPNFNTIVNITQDVSYPNFSDDNAYIKFYTDQTASTETKIYGPITGEYESTQQIYFKVFGKNDNGVLFELTDISKITSITSDTCTCLFESLIFIGVKNIFRCNIKIPTNNGSPNSISGELSLTCADAEYTDGSLGLITISGLSINNSDSNITPKNKDHNITVTVENSLKGTCIYKQNAGSLSSEYIKEIEYELILSGDKVTGADNWVYTNTNNNIYVENDKKYVKWKENTEAHVRGGNFNDIKLTCNCYKVFNNGNKEQTIYQSNEVSPKQKYDLSLDIPKEYKLQNVKWTTLFIFDSDDYTKTTEALKITPTGTNYKSITNISANGDIVPIYFKIFGIATYNNGTSTYKSELFYGASPDMANPVSNITCNIVNKTSNAVIINSGEINGTENFLVNINVGATVNTSNSVVAEIYFDLAADTSKDKYWGDVRFNNSNKAVSISQNGYTEISYSGEITYIEFSIDENKWERYDNTTIKYEKNAPDIIEKVYFKIFFNVYKRENNVIVSTDKVVYNDSVKVTSNNTNINPTTTCDGSIFTLSSLGMIVNSEYDSIFSITTSKITYNYKNTYNININAKAFNNCLRIVKHNLWNTITFYSTEDCKTPISEMYVNSDESNYTIYFKITNSYNNTTYVGDTSNIVLYENNLISSSSLSISCTSTNTSGVYSITRNISNVDEDKIIYTINNCSCQTYPLNGSINIGKRATIINCFLNFYSPLADETYYDNWVYENIFKTTGDISNTSITSVVGNFNDVETKKIFVKASEKPQIIFNNVTSVSTTINIDNISDNLYSFDIVSNDSTINSATYEITVSCVPHDKLTLVLPAKSVRISYKVVWNNVIWGADLHEIPSNTTQSKTSESGCFKDESFSYRFMIQGTMTTYENGVPVTDSSETVYLEDTDYIKVIEDRHQNNETHLLKYHIYRYPWKKTIFYIKGVGDDKIPNNISDTDTPDRSCSISIGVIRCITGDTTWESYSSLNNSTFTLHQYGNVWDPYFTIN